MIEVFYVPCPCGDTGVERTPNKSQHTKLTLENKSSRRSCRDSRSQPFDYECGVLTKKLSRLHGSILSIISSSTPCSSKS